MRKMVLALMVIIGYMNSNEERLSSRVLWKKYGIDLHIRGRSGWKRVCSSGSLQNFATKHLTEEEQEKICGFIGKTNGRRNSQITRIDDEK